MNSDVLKTILDSHVKWLRRDSDGVMADLRGANLSRANLSEADLHGANLSEADLHGANLYGANLNGANLNGTCLDPELVTMQRAFCRACPADTDGYRIVYRTEVSQHVGSTKYEPGQVYTAPVLSADIVTGCHPGIYAGSLEWMRKEYPNAALVKCRVQDGDWFITAKGAIRTCKLEVLECVKEAD